MIPTIKQEKAFNELVGNGGNVNKAMLDAGYSEATAHTPQKLTDSEGFKLLADDFVTKLKKERERAIKAMTTKDLDKVRYESIADVVDKLTKNIQLLTGEATDRTVIVQLPEELINKNANDVTSKPESDSKGLT